MNIKINNVLSRSLRILAIVLLSEFIVSFASPSSDVANLLKFKDSLQNVGNQLPDWNSSNPLCKWQGVICEDEYVWGLKLEYLGLKGTINVDALKELSKLRTISLMNNNFETPFPEIKKLVYLKSIYLSNNKYEGEIPDDGFDGMISLKKIYLANNKFTGHIPNSLTKLAKITELSFENNQFSGQIPDFSLDRLQVFNISNNKFQGPIPSTFSSMDASFFSGNQELCGAPLEKCKSNNSVAPMSTSTKVIFSIVIAAAIAAIAALVVIQLRRKRILLPLVKKHVPNSSKNQKKDAPTSSAKKLSFLRDDRTKFDMEDLMKSSAEKLGNGVLGSSYKAAINGEQGVVVKRCMEMNNVDKEEFVEHMRRLGRLDHENLIPLLAFNYRKHEKLLVTDYIENVGLAACLHGLDWPTRLNIIKGIARGLKYLYNELPTLVSPHGHLKASNVIITPSTSQPILTDFGLLPIIDQEFAQENMVCYKSPEFKHSRRIAKKTDVWSLGILMLEILTGKLSSTNTVNITTWVQTFLKNDELTPEVLDKNMKGTEGCEGEIMNMFKVALKCCDGDVDRRWDIKEAVKEIDEIKEKDGDIYSTDDVRDSTKLSIELAI